MVSLQITLNSYQKPVNPVNSDLNLHSVNHVNSKRPFNYTNDSNQTNLKNFLHENFRFSHSTETNSTQNKTVLLQTASAYIIPVGFHNPKQICILFDNGSQLSYITPKAANMLKLKWLSKHEQITKTFGKNKTFNT